ncbi:MAG: polyprenyl synthetase family protein [Desulfovibrionaceae bacterium]|nr:polyprenyl synthetase family protein [Desulfovibrionaceae bacterium]
MQELKLALEQEQSRINAALERFTAELPDGSQPVARHVLAAGGKRLRPFLTLLIGRLFGCRDETLYTLGAAVEMLHAATLLHDDILDNADLRRGQPAAHTLFAPATVILAGDAMLAKAMFMVSRIGDTRLTDCISEAVMRTAEGEIAEFNVLRNPDLSPEDYLAVIIGKTAWMLRASCELGAIFSGADSGAIRTAADFGLQLGIAFQMVDDALDFSAGTGKPCGGDLREGKVTPPLLSYIAALPPHDAAAFKERFRRGPLNEDEVAALCSAVCSGGHDRRTREQAGEHLAAAASFLQPFPPSEERTVLEQMLEYILKRDH